MAERMNRGPKMVEIRDKSPDELAQALDRAKDELFRLKLAKSTNQLENVNQIRTKRKEVARIMTVVAARKAGLETHGAAAAPQKEQK